MAKITIIISEDVENKLRDYIRSKYRKPFGKLSEVIERSIEEYLEKESKEASE